MNASQSSKEIECVAPGVFHIVAKTDKAQGVLLVPTKLLVRASEAPDHLFIIYLVYEFMYNIF